MSDILARICEDKKAHIERKKQERSLNDLEKLIEVLPPTRGFISTLRDLQARQETGLIAEVKKASPSKGVLRQDFDPAGIARIYEQSGAACLSVLTDEPYFQGKDEYIDQIKRAVDLPVLRKDFMLEPYQIAESRAIGADCVLLIMAALSDSQAKELYQAAGQYNLDVLVEVHDTEEMDRALAVAPGMIGVNNRNLKTLEIDLQTGLNLAGKYPENVVKVAESGFHTHEDVQRFRKAGYNSFLIGEHMMRQPDIGLATRKILGKNPAQG